jgi:hypothetical protein
VRDTRAFPGYDRLGEEVGRTVLSDRREEGAGIVEEPRLAPVGSGLAPVTEGWFVVNVREAAWLTNEAFGARCVFEADRPVLRKRPDLEVQRFADLGVTLAVLAPGKPSGMYHAESNQEDFLVLTGECLLLVEEEKRALRAWDSCTARRAPHTPSSGRATAGA